MGPQIEGPTHHPDRQRVLAELHARPFTPTPTPARLLHFAFMVSHDGAEEDRARVETLADSAPGPGSLADRRHLSLNNGTVRWERHGEFISYTLAVPSGAPARWPLDFVPPGPLLVAVDLRLVQEPVHANTMVHALIVDGKAVLSTDFAPNADSFVPITIANLDMTNEVAGATVQRVLEIETYRSLALLGLPIAEQAASTLNAIEGELPALMERMGAASSLEDNQNLLDRLTSMSLDLERSSASTHFRFGATRAYAELVRLRLEALEERTEHGGRGLTCFLSRRFDPAIRTCATVAERELNLARKLTRAAQLLRTRVDIALESQNRDLLKSMGARLRLQLRLQQTVEGLSVVAISYYVASLFHLMMSGFRFVGYWISIDLLTALAVIPIVLTVTLAMRRVRRNHHARTKAY